MREKGFENAPGCFASALTFRADAEECQTCSFSAACAPRSIANLEALRAKFGIKAPESKGEKQSFAVPVKTAALLDKITSLGLDIKGAFAKDVNPFAQSAAPNFIKLAAHILIRREQGLMRKELATAFALQFEWTPETAASHALQAVQAFVALGVVDETDGRIKRRRMNNAQDH